MKLRFAVLAILLFICSGFPIHAKADYALFQNEYSSGLKPSNTVDGTGNVVFQVDATNTGQIASLTVHVTCLLKGDVPAIIAGAHMDNRTKAYPTTTPFDPNNMFFLATSSTPTPCETTGNATTTLNFSPPLTILSGETVFFRFYRDPVATSSSVLFGIDTTTNRIDNCEVYRYLRYFSGAWQQYGGTTYNGCVGAWLTTNATGDLPPQGDPAYDYTSTTTTRIIKLVPLDRATYATSGVIAFGLDYYISENDLGGFAGGYKVSVYLENIDQNVVLARSASPSNYIFIDSVNVDTAGLYFYATSALLGDGNYKVFASLTKNYFGYTYGDIIMAEHQFVVGTSTFVGALSQNITNDLNAIFASTTATSTANSTALCNPISLQFSLTSCVGFLLIPDAESFKTTIHNFYNGVLVRVPFGYLTRFVAILNGKTQTPLPSFTVNIQIAPTATTSLTFDIDDMLAGGASLVNNTRDRTYGKNARDIFEPMIQFTFGLMFILYVVSDLTKIKQGSQKGKRENT